MSLVKKSLSEASGQLNHGVCNILVVCTQLYNWERGSSDSFFDFLYGATMFTKNGERFEPCGELVKHGSSRYTRISAIASFDGDIILPRYSFQFSLFLNPHAAIPLDTKLFQNAEIHRYDLEKCTIQDGDAECRIIRVND